jgi:uncharacterized protein (DUF2164 family)
MKKIDNTILWLQSATNALKEVENYLREINRELDQQQEKYLQREIELEYGADKVEYMMEFVRGELGAKSYSMTVSEIMDEIASADQCEWCGTTTNIHSAEIMSSVGDEKVCIDCKSNG